MEQYQKHGGLQSIELHNNRCLNVRSNRADCRECSKTCPSGAITYKTGCVSFEQSKCLACGMCLSICPTESFTSETWAEKVLIENLMTFDCEDEIILACPKNENRNLEGVHRISVCFGSYSLGALLEAALDKKLVFLVDTCPNCECRYGKALLESRVKLINDCLGNIEGQSKVVLSSNFDNSENTHDAPPFFDERIDIEYLGRHGFLAGFARRGSKLFSALTDADPKKLFPSIPTQQIFIKQHLPAWRDRLKHFWANEKRLENVDLIWPSIEIRENSCVGCGVCRQYCPSGALIQTCSDGSFETQFTPGLCIDCGLCALSCSKQVIKRGYSRTRNPFSSRTVYEATSKKCIRCSAPVLTPESELCFWCSSEKGPEKLMHELKRHLLDDIFLENRY